MRIINRWLVTVFLLFMFTASAIADRDVYLPIPENGQSQENIEKIVINFFAERCNFPLEDVKKAFNERKEPECFRFGLFGYGYIHEPENTPVWDVSFQLHGSDHLVLLNPEGEILFWQSHGTEHYPNEPDILESAIPAIPLETDANEELILADVKENLKAFGNYSEKEIEQFIYQTHFVYEKHFNSGEIPVWLTYVYDGERLLCKQANGYDGSLMCMSAPNADFGEYRTALPCFEDVMDFEYSPWYMDAMTVEEKAVQAEIWRPAVEQWMRDYPYSANTMGLPYDVTIRQIYGVPDGKSITQEEAEQIAKEYASQLGISDRFKEKRPCYADYFMTDPENPIWKIIVDTPRDISIEEKKKCIGVDESIFKSYVVEIHAYTGEVSYSTVVGSDTPDYIWKY